ncbi:peptide-methionine (S)-S-oxide reductase [Vibrio caribbeanicus]|uniref:Peptide methionine sulfoxide reductase MsrA n=1 Tax=Vibrio caribbeanicus ATCC BAA-2122 TaxID=796620 RepID=E3BJT7_9VIBR|nr:peptide-methionine (S)-S-oxide reductase [Vibrio caribbeanicus]EFP96856.1 methionine sulfoxide reductase A [Vibrio caribbeanicus ATCC BAA-2122]
MIEEVYLAGGCLWGVQEFIRHVPGVVKTEAGRANGSSSSTTGPYDDYVECVKTCFDPSKTSIERLMTHLFEIIDPYSVDQQGADVGRKYRTGLYSTNTDHLTTAKSFIANREDADRITVEVLLLTNYVPSDAEHQDRLTRFPDDYCHIPTDLMKKYRSTEPN